jgi:very-short-patch-repair endonuclease
VSIRRWQACLFHVAKPPGLNAEGANRARSATEAFLYRRLETLPDTAGRFHLNTELPIPFDGWGRMEVDLLDADAHIAIELDGGQHLNNAEAYRRDRRKDVLLQENGFHVLRFLCEDVGRCLNEVLDAIFRALSHRARSNETRSSQDGTIRSNHDGHYSDERRAVHT